MIRRPWRYRRHPADAKGIEDAKLALSIARSIEPHAERISGELEQMRQRNHFGPKFAKALGAPPR